ncbi:hypothetical protein COT79_00790 [Candidatus Berkelbacteria bacterium CG10_big_fil_rev_8_21_14_0_10_43_14]|uniref:Glycosyltransferase family 1 protein n=1 Tax=Candidatus Berkelbacteria bacterium CG10_big_fil_rev_8_21_14_0_10_43_14 TaxID=1974515 RepID=A0A2M6R976_9BACT|nr:MAG: hypothetical protein COT79_00790 [Candidatus Berkelbacteria bacterium CG10_big_fil_rev_8_21_14_0_10_43_14]
MKHRIAINGYFTSRPFTGFGVYTWGYLKAFTKIADKEKYDLIVLVPKKPAITLGGAVRFVECPLANDTPINKILWEQRAIPAACKKYDVDLLHSMYPATVIFDKGIPQLTSIHDATPWHFAEHSQGLAVKLLHRYSVWSNKKADRVVSVSNYGKYDVEQIFGIPKGKIDVVYNGVDNRYREHCTQAGKERIRAKYNLPEKYIFYIGGFEVHKNVRRLFQSFARASSEIKHDLVIAGGVFSKARPAVYKDYFDLPKLIANYKLEKRVHMIGVVPEEDLPALYQASSLYIMPSLAEGFNLPLVQAFACKVPTISANTPATGEIAGHASYLVDATNIEAMAAAIVRLLHDKKRQNELITEGIVRQKQFTWENAAERMLALYDSLLNR